MQQRKSPCGSAWGCRTMFPKRELIRVVRSPEGGLSLDFKGKAPDAARICAEPGLPQKSAQVARH